MSDSPVSESPPSGVTAGSLLRQARMAKGLHIAALATSIKVAPRKLELLESDRFDELPGATFTRALAQTVCRSLKIDPAPVLALLPQPAEQGLGQMGLGLNAPFRDRPGRRVPGDLPFLRSPVMLGAAVLVLASVSLYLLPTGWVEGIRQSAEAPTGVTTEAVVPAQNQVPAVAEPVLPAASSVAEGLPADSAPTIEPAVAAEASQAPATPVAGVLLLRTSAESWVEVIDGHGAPLISRMLQPGETVGLDGASPLRVRIGNASATQVSFKGRPIELVPTRDNVAKLELK